MSTRARIKGFGILLGIKFGFSKSQSSILSLYQKWCKRGPGLLKNVLFLLWNTRYLILEQPRNTWTLKSALSPTTLSSRHTLVRQGKSVSSAFAVRCLAPSSITQPVSFSVCPIWERETAERLCTGQSPTRGRTTLSSLQPSMRLSPGFLSLHWVCHRGCTCLWLGVQDCL